MVYMYVVMFTLRCNLCGLIAISTVCAACRFI